MDTEKTNEMEGDTQNPQENQAAEPKKEQVKEMTELEKVTAQRDEYLQGWQRAKADFANSKKRMDEDMKSFRAMATESVIEELLPVLQSFEMAFANKAAWEKADKNWRTGVEYIYTQLKSVVEQNGLTEVQAVGKTFDPMIHEAVKYEPAPDGVKEGTIISVIEKGYTLGGKLIKPAKVVVAEAK